MPTLPRAPGAPVTGADGAEPVLALPGAPGASVTDADGAGPEAEPPVSVGEAAGPPAGDVIKVSSIGAPTS